MSQTNPEARLSEIKKLLESLADQGNKKKIPV
jgi:hypothetical protein